MKLAETVLKTNIILKTEQMMVVRVRDKARIVIAGESLLAEAHKTHHRNAENNALLMIRMLRSAVALAEWVQRVEPILRKAEGGEDIAEDMIQLATWAGEVKFSEGLA
jgi:hypothetical protein